MRGLKPHSHADRQRVIEEITPLIQAQFGDNLIALAVSSSFARNDDTAYSDLELVAFVKEMPEGQRWKGKGWIRDGLLVELVWMTRATYLGNNKSVTEDWYIAGSDVLEPIINPDFIIELTSYPVENQFEKCLEQAVDRWHEVQEGTAKVLNAILAENRDGIPLLVFDMIHQMLIVLSFLNQIPYVTFSRFISQSRQFTLKPEGFDQLLDFVVQGRYQDLRLLEEVVLQVFSQFEEIFASLGVELYDQDFSWLRLGEP